MRLYVDGSLTATQPSAALGSLDTNLPLALGALYRGSLGSTIEFFPGYLDEVRIWNQARSSAEIAADQRRSLAGNEAGLVGYWRLDEGLGLTAADAVSPGHSARLGDLVPAQAPAWTGLAPQAEQRVLRVRFLDLGGLDAATFTTPGFWQLLAAGADRLFETADDTNLAALLVAVAWDASTQTAILHLSAPLPDGLLQVRLDGTAGITDLAGNALGNGADVVVGTLWSETAPAAVTLELPAAQDSGYSSTDTITSRSSPTLNVTVNRAGRLEIDLDGDGTADDSTNAPAAGTYSFTPAAPLADGTYSLQVGFLPVFGDATTATLALTIDTQGPTARADVSVLAPLYRQRVVFSEAIIVAEFTPADVTLHAADGTPLGNATAVTPQDAASPIGTVFEITFEPLWATGDTTLRLGPNLTDLAGNPMNQDGDANNGEDPADRLTATLHVAAPVAGLRAERLEARGPATAPFQALEIVFNRPLDPATLGAADVTLTDGTGSVFHPAPTLLNPCVVGLDLSGLTLSGPLTLLLGPDLAAATGERMDQEGNGTPGETTDVFRALLLVTDLQITTATLTYEGWAIAVAGATLTVDGPHRFGSVDLLHGATLTHPAATTTQEYRLDLELGRYLRLDPASAVDVSGRGYLPNRTLGNTPTGAASGRSSASHGGYGVSDAGTTNDVYGDYRNPNELGAGGAGNIAVANRGGGLVRIAAAALQLDGAVRANGGNGQDSGWGNHAGGGAGGGIRLTVGRLGGTGLVQADGGGYGPRAGGGRVALTYDDATRFDLDRVQALPGKDGWGAAACGTVYLQNSAAKAARGVLRIDAKTRAVAAGNYTPLGVDSAATFAAEDVILSGANVVAAPHHQMPVSATNLSVLNGAVLTHRPTDAANEFSLLLTVAGTLTVDATAALDVSARGYLANHTLGNTTSGAASGRSSASYGGYGSSDAGTTNEVYGDYRDPAELGAGGAGNISVANAGGGLIRLSAAILHLDGALRANGGSGEDRGWGNYAGGGAGGGLCLTVGSLAGSGTIQADGGNNGPRGGGGRVAIFYDDAADFDLTQVQALPGDAGWGPASCGTVFLKPTTGAGVLRIDSRGRTLGAGAWTPLGLPDQESFSVEHLILAGTGVTAAAQHPMPIQAVALDILAGATLTHLPSSAALTAGLDLSVTGALTVDDGGLIDVSGRGYLAGRATGNSTTGGATGYSGASYGGLGVASGGASNALYGSATLPTEPGSGGAGNIATANAGGGYARLTAGSLTLNGAVRANGGNAEDRGWGNASGAGSGGGLLFSLGTLTGAGFISANGGNGAAPAGAGGGGRIAIHCTGPNTLVPGHVAASGGSGGPGAGGDGSVDNAPAGSETTAPFLLAVTPAGTVDTAVTQIRFVFSEAINPATFTLADLQIVDPSGATLPSTGLNLTTVGPDRFTLNLTSALTQDGLSTP